MIHSPRNAHAGFRPLYSEGGPALLALSQRIMPLADCSVTAVRDAYTPRFLEPLLDTNANTFFLLFSPGFEPEKEKPFQEAFAGAAEFLGDQGCEAAACVSAGHCDAALRNSNQPAVRGRNKPVPSWIPGFRMACWTHPDMRSQVLARALAALDCGARGVCFDTLFFGAAPAVLGPHIIGPAGCACARCRGLFEKETGTSAAHFPPRHHENPDLFFQYVAWRARVVADTVGAWAAAVHEKSPGALMACRLPHPCQGNPALVFGADTAQIAAHCDAVLSETTNLIDFNKTGLTYDGATLDMLRAAAPGKDIASLPWRAGPHIETEPAPALWAAALGEAATCGAALAPRATLLFQRDTLAPATLAQDSFHEHRAALGRLWNWIDHTPEMFEDMAPFAPVGLVHDPESWIRHWSQCAPAFLKMYATLSELHVPFRVVARTELTHGAPEGVKLLIAPPRMGFTDTEIQTLQTCGAHLLFLGHAPAWAPQDNCAALDAALFAEPEPRPAQRASWRRLMHARHSGSPAPYMQHRAPASGPLARLLAHYAHFTVPDKWKDIFDTVQALRTQAGDHISIEAPPYIAVRLWRSPCGGRMAAHAAHLLPDFNGPKLLRISVPGAASARILTPDRNRITYVQNPDFTVEIITYAAVDLRMQ
jgi:hypothetical protein